MSDLLRSRQRLVGKGKAVGREHAGQEDGGPDLDGPGAAIRGAWPARGSLDGCATALEGYAKRGGGDGGGFNVSGPAKERCVVKERVGGPECSLAQGARRMDEMEILRDILLHAEAGHNGRGREGRRQGSGLCVALADVLKSYEMVLLDKGLVPSEDTYFYRLLLQMSMDRRPDWWIRYETVCRWRSLRIRAEHLRLRVFYKLGFAGLLRGLKGPRGAAAVRKGRLAAGDVPRNDDLDLRCCLVCLLLLPPPSSLPPSPLLPSPLSPSLSCAPSQGCSSFLNCTAFPWKTNHLHSRYMYVLTNFYAPFIHVGYSLWVSRRSHAMRRILSFPMLAAGAV